MIATIVDTQALLETIAASLAAGVGVTFTFSLAILGFARFADASRQGHRGEATLFASLALVGLAASLAAIAAGVIVVAS